MCFFKYYINKKLGIYYSKYSEIISFECFVKVSLLKYYKTMNEIC